jgi:hypothetical protein
VSPRWDRARERISPEKFRSRGLWSLFRTHHEERAELLITLESLDGVGNQRETEEAVLRALSDAHGELRAEVSELLAEREPEAYVEELTISRGSITLALVIAGVLGYGNLRQSLEYIARDLRWLMRHVDGFSIGVSSTTIGAGLRRNRDGCASQTSPQLVRYLVLSHFLLLLSGLVAAGFLMASAL